MYWPDQPHKFMLPYLCFLSSPSWFFPLHCPPPFCSVLKLLLTYRIHGENSNWSTAFRHFYDFLKCSQQRNNEITNKDKALKSPPVDNTANLRRSFPTDIRVQTEQKERLEWTTAMIAVAKQCCALIRTFPLGENFPFSLCPFLPSSFLPNSGMVPLLPSDVASPFLSLLLHGIFLFFPGGDCFLRVYRASCFLFQQHLLQMKCCYQEN